MFRLHSLSILVASLAIFHGTVAGAEAPPLTVEQQEVVKVSQAWLDAFNNRDLETFNSYIADDYIGSTDDGVLTTKVRLVKWLSKRPSEYQQRKDLHDIQVHLDGDTAIVNYLITSLRTWGDTPIVNYLRRTEVFKRMNGKWLVIASHESLLPVSFFKTVKIDSKILNDYVGQYDWPRHEVEEIDKYTVEDGRLISEWRGVKKECLPMAKDTFFARDDSGWWTFTRDGQGRVTGYVYSYPDGQEVVVKKIK